MPKNNPSYNKIDAGQLPRGQTINVGFKTTDPVLLADLRQLQEEINRKFTALETRINRLEGVTDTMSFDTTTDTSFELIIQRGIIQDFSIT